MSTIDSSLKSNSEQMDIDSMPHTSSDFSNFNLMEDSHSFMHITEDEMMTDAAANSCIAANDDHELTISEDPIILPCNNNSEDDKILGIESSDEDPLALDEETSTADIVADDGGNLMPIPSAVNSNHLILTNRTAVVQNNPVMSSSHFISNSAQILKTKNGQFIILQPNQLVTSQSDSSPQILTSLSSSPTGILKPIIVNSNQLLGKGTKFLVASSHMNNNEQKVKFVSPIFTSNTTTTQTTSTYVPIEQITTQTTSSSMPKEQIIIQTADQPNVKRRYLSKTTQANLTSIKQISPNVAIKFNTINALQQVRRTGVGDGVEVKQQTNLQSNDTGGAKMQYIRIPISALTNNSESVNGASSKLVRIVSADVNKSCGQLCSTNQDLIIQSKMSSKTPIAPALPKQSQVKPIQIIPNQNKSIQIIPSPVKPIQISPNKKKPVHLNYIFSNQAKPIAQIYTKKPPASLPRSQGTNTDALATNSNTVATIRVTHSNTVPTDGVTSSNSLINDIATHNNNEVTHVKTVVYDSSGQIKLPIPTAVYDTSEQRIHPAPTFTHSNSISSNQLLLVSQFLQNQAYTKETNSQPVSKNVSKTLIDANVIKSRKPCNCNKSQCLKLYCDCFANGEFCHGCNCIHCNNNLQYEDERQRAIRSILDRNPTAFKPKIGKGSTESRRHNKGCNCKRSGCLKNYCECYEAKISCSHMCRCLGCRNIEQCNREAVERKRRLMQIADAAEAKNLSETTKRQISLSMPSPSKRIPFSKNNACKISQEVVEATCHCLLAQAEKSENSPTFKLENSPTFDQSMELSILSEFSRCLVQIIGFNSKKFS